MVNVNKHVFRSNFAVTSWVMTLLQSFFLGKKQRA